jgi:very-short-patch-repair endonuclease
MNVADQNPKASVVSPEVAAVFREQFGVASRAQLLKAGVHRLGIARAVERGLMARVRPGIFRSILTPESWEQRLVVASLAVGGSVVSHRSAARLHGFSGFEDAEWVEVSTTTGARAKGVLVHRMSELPRAEVTTVRGIPVTREARTLLDLCDVAPERLVAKALDDALRRRLVRYQLLDGLLQGRSARRKGSRIMRALLAERAPEDVRAASDFESRFLRLLRRRKLPQPEKINVDLVDERGEFLARPDFMYGTCRVVIFLDGRAFHLGVVEFEKDRRQTNALVARGWTVLRYTWNRVVNEEDDVVAEIRTVLERTGSRPGSTG